LKLSFKHSVINKIDIFKFGLYKIAQCLNDILHFIFLQLFSIFKG